jgi:hypothetical protein
MANGNFVVQNGLQVGALTIDAATGSITTTGNITTTGTTTTFINEIVTGTEAVYGMLTANSGIASTSTSTGALVVTGGVGISGATYIGGNLSVTGNITFTGNVTSVAITGNAGSFFGNATTGYGALYAGIPTGYTALPYTPVQVTTNSNAYSQTNQQNLNAGANASSDYVATANNGTDSTFYADFGIASSTYNYPALGLTAVGANDTYLLGVGYNSFGPYTGNVGNVVISSSNGMIKLAAGGANVANVIATVTTSGIIPGANAAYNLGSSTAWWGTMYGVSTQAKYADLAENYQADGYYAPGTVVEFGGAEEVTLAAEGTKRVAGVVSTNPAHLMNGGLTGTNVVALALQGRVPCKVIGPVAKGDLMVSAGFGYAKTNNDAAVGQTIGKALADFSGAKGVIEVVVGRI